MLIITPAIKGQVTKAIEAARTGHNTDFSHTALRSVRQVLQYKLPREQGKHLAKRLLRERGIAV